LTRGTRSARALGITRVGIFRSAERNRLVEDHYEKLGFTPCGCPLEGSTLWSLDVAGYKDLILPMKVVRLGSMAPACPVD
jgi:hypothetical protein